MTSDIFLGSRQTIIYVNKNAAYVLHGISINDN